MGWGDPDVYGSPEKFGLELVVMCDDPGLSYEFDMFGIWRDTATGQVYYGIDGGCSCPSPFENFTSVDDLTPVSSATELRKALSAWGRPSWPDVQTAVAKIADLRFPVRGAVIRNELPAAASDEDAELLAAVTAAARKAALNGAN
jgi:hypothetical protein